MVVEACKAMLPVILISLTNTVILKTGLLDSFVLGGGGGGGGAGERGRVVGGREEGGGISISESAFWLSVALRPQKP